MLRQTVLLSLLAISSPILADDWPQFQGKNRNAVSNEKGLLKTWADSGPTLVWTYSQAGVGYSSSAVVGDRLYTSGVRDQQEVLIGLDAKKGTEIWVTPIGPVFDFKGNQWGAGPRTTPTVVDSMVFALGGGGQMIAVNSADGNLVWKKHMMNDLGGEVDPIGGGPGTKPEEPKIGWGYSWSPFVDGSHLICFPGGPKGAVAALDWKTGNEVWRSKDFVQQASYASPLIAEIEGVKQYIFLHNKGLTAISPESGSTLWNWDKEYPDIVIPTPVIVGSQIYVSVKGNTAACDLLSVTKNGNAFQADQQYKGKAQRVMKNTVGGSVVIDGYVYGFSDGVGLVCQELATGKQMWAARQPLKAGSLIAAEGMIYFYDEENRQVALLEANPNEFVLKSKFTLPIETKFASPSGKAWTPLSLSNGYLYVRDQENIFCYKVTP